MERAQMKYLAATVCTVNMLAFTDGFTVSWASPVTAKLEQNTPDTPFDRPLTTSEISWIGGIVNLGSMCGPAIFSFLSVTIGRKFTALCIAIPFLISYITMAFARDVVLYCVARFIGGLAIGGTVMLIPIYLAELSHKSIRGAIGTTIKVFTVSGSFLPYALGPFIPLMWFNLILCIPSLIFIIFFLFTVPETPQYLITRGKDEQAKVTIGRYYSSDVKSSFEEIRDIIDANRAISFIEAFSNRYNLKAMLITIGAFTLMRLSGANIVLSYTQNILNEADTSLSPDTASIIVGGVQVLSCLITPFFLDRHGRRLFLCISSFGMMVMSTSLGIYFYIGGVDSARWLPILFLVLHLFTYCLGVASIPPILMAELLPTTIKAKASALVVTLGSAISFGMTKTFPVISEEYGMYGPFWFFAFCNILMILYAIFVIPETKGKSFKELEIIFNKVKE